MLFILRQLYVHFSSQRFVSLPVLLTLGRNIVFLSEKSLSAMFDRGGDKAGEERMRSIRTGAELCREDSVIPPSQVTSLPAPCFSARLSFLHLPLVFHANHGQSPVCHTQTWRHIANAEIYRKVANICRAKGYEPPIICTPEELQGK